MPKPDIAWAGGVKGKLGGVLMMIGAIKAALDDMNETEGDLLKIDIATKRMEKQKKRLRGTKKRTRIYNIFA